MMDEMNEINDFMAKFDSSFEIKWGVAFDPELGKKVKVTILATGFGIENVDGMNKHLGNRYSQEEADRCAREEEEKARRQERMETYYGRQDGNSQYKRRPKVYLFHPNDLNNEDVILAIENTPTYKRTQQQLDDIRNQAQGKSATDTNDNNDATPVQGVISFA